MAQERKPWSGNNAYSGGTTLNAGELFAGSATALGSGGVTINEGTLGTSEGNHAIQVGDNTHVSNYSQNAGTLFLEGASPASFDHLTIAGAAALGGNLTVDVLNGFAPNGAVDLIHADGGVTDNGQTVTLILPSYLQGQVTYGTDDVELTFNQLLLGRTPGLTANQEAVANYIDSVAPTGKITALANNIYPLINNPNAEGAALNQISPQSLQVFHSIAFDNATFNSQMLNDHLSNLRDGLTGFDGSQLTVNDPSLDPRALPDQWPPSGLESDRHTRPDQRHHRPDLGWDRHERQQKCTCRGNSRINFTMEYVYRRQCCPGRSELQ